MAICHSTRTEPPVRSIRPTHMTPLVPASCVALALLAGGCADASGTATTTAAAVITSSPGTSVDAPSPSSSPTTHSTRAAVTANSSPSAKTPDIPSAPPVLPCASYHLMTSTTSDGHRPDHTAAEALTALKAAHAGPDHRTAVVLTRMAIPFAQKLGLGSPRTIRLVWVVYGNDIVKPRPPRSAGPVDPYPVGTVLPVFWMVDDSTLQLGGTYLCNGQLPAPTLTN